MASTILRSMVMTAAAATLVISCSKDEGDTNSGANFSPLTQGSTWTYQSSTGSSFTLTATSRDTAIGGKNYRVLSNTAGSNLYLAKEGDNYYRFGSIAELNLQAVEELYLKAGEAVNATWGAPISFTVPGVPVPLTANLTYTIKEKGATRTAGGKSYNNVTHVRMDISITGLGNIGGGDFYYAEGVGMVENAILVNVPGQATINQTQTLTAYAIK